MGESARPFLDLDELSAQLLGLVLTLAQQTGIHRGVEGSTSGRESVWRPGGSEAATAVPAATAVTAQSGRGAARVGLVRASHLRVRECAAVAQASLRCIATRSTSEVSGSAAVDELATSSSLGFKGRKSKLSLHSRCIALCVMQTARCISSTAAFDSSCPGAVQPRAGREHERCRNRSRTCSMRGLPGQSSLQRCCRA